MRKKISLLRGIIRCFLSPITVYFFIQTTSNICIFISDMIDTYIRPLDMEDNIFRISLMLSVPINKVFFRKFIKYDIRLTATSHSVEIFPYHIEYLFSELR